jgi:phage terminase large subunit GpA-like protein
MVASGHRFLASLARSMRPPRLRTMRQFAEQEIVLTTGPYRGSRFKCERNPYAGLLLEAFDSGRWRRRIVTGPSQSGKTLVGCVIPILYHLFEICETVILGAPTSTIAMDKWKMDLLPAIRASRYAHLLPTKGAGSQGGEIEMIEFGNGAVLRVMTAGGDDQSRANFTSRILCVTETEGFDEVGESSREADKFAQLEARTNAFADRAITYAECTVSNETGRTWREYTGGTASKILMRCPHCAAFVTPDREHLVNWRGVETEIDAKRAARLACPSCGVMWSEEDRAAAMRAATVIHRGQTIVNGMIEGGAADTETLGFRWTAANNLLVPMGEVGRKEWLAARATDEETANRELSQFYWATPPKTDGTGPGELATSDIVSRAGRLGRGEIPETASALIIGVDVGKWVCHWVATAFTRQADGAVNPHVVDYGRFDVPTADMKEEDAIRVALRNFRDGIARELFLKLKPVTPGVFPLRLGVVDAGYKQDIAMAFAGESAATAAAPWGWAAAKGQGLRQYGQGGERPPGSVKLAAGDAWEAWQFPDRTAQLIEHRSDHWKGFVHAALSTPLGASGCMSLFAASNPGEHLTLARHLLAEKATEEWVAGKGMVRRWVAKSRQNHFLDALAYTCLGASLAGVLIPAAVQQAETQVPQPEPVAVARPVETRAPVRQERESSFLPERPRRGWLG